MPDEEEVVVDDAVVIEDAAGTEDAKPAEGEDNAGADQLGDAGKKALDAMKVKWQTERDARKKSDAELAELKKPKPKEGDKPDLEQLRNEAREQVQSETLRERALDKIEAKAARLFKDPEDAVLRLGRNIDDFIDGGKVDVDAIGEALKELLEKRPDFGVTQGESKRFLGEGDGGQRGKPTGGKPQLTEADVKRLSKEGKYEEIESARVAGRLNDLLGITT